MIQTILTIASFSYEVELILISFFIGSKVKAIEIQDLGKRAKIGHYYRLTRKYTLKLSKNNAV
jgi:hypothetical protein